MTIDLQNELRIRDKKLSISIAKNAELVQNNIELKESNYELVEALKFLDKFNAVETFSEEWEKLASEHMEITEKALTKAKNLTK